MKSHSLLLRYDVYGSQVVKFCKILKKPCIPTTHPGTTSALLCISISQMVLHMLFAGQNHRYQHFNIFSVANREKKGKSKTVEKYTKIDKRFYQCSGAILKCWMTQKCWWIPGKICNANCMAHYRIMTLIIWYSWKFISKMCNFNIQNEINNYIIYII